MLAHSRLLALAACSAVLFGCVSAQLTHLDPSFTPSALKQGAMAIGGVTVINTAEKLTDREKTSMIDYFEREMKKRRPEVPLLAHQTVQAALGENVLSSVVSVVASQETIQHEHARSNRRHADSHP